MGLAGSGEKIGLEGGVADKRATISIGSRGVLGLWARVYTGIVGARERGDAR